MCGEKTRMCLRGKRSISNMAYIHILTKQPLKQAVFCSEKLEKTIYQIYNMIYNHPKTGKGENHESLRNDKSKAL